MAYSAGLYTKASEASAAEAGRFRQFQTDIDAMAARERAGLYRRDQAQMDQFTAGLTPQSNIAVPDWSLPAAPPAPAPTAGGVGAPGTPGYERNRLMQERKLLEDQYNAEVSAQRTAIDSLGKQKYILEQQLTAAPPYKQQAIRDELTRLELQINKTVTGTRERVKEFRTFFETIDNNIRLTDKGQAIMSGPTPAAPGGYTPGDVTGDRPEQPALLGSGATAPIPVPDSLEMFPDAAAPAPAADPAAPAAAPPPAVNAEGQAYLASLTAAQFEALSKEEQDKVLAAVNRERQTNRDRANFLTLPAAAADFATLPFDGLIKLFNLGSDAVDLPRYARVIGIDVDRIQMPYPGGDRMISETPWIDLAQTLAENSQPLTREQFIENLKAAEQQSGKTDLPPTAGVTPPATPEAAAAAGSALQPTPDVPIGDPANPRVAAITEYSNASIAKRIKDLPPIVGKAVTSDQGQRIINRAREIGVDPVAAIAIYGIETTFGASKGESGKGAVGPLQVSAGDWPKFQQWFLNPNNQSRYKFGPELAEIASNATASSIDAGLLRLKYNELVGVEKNLWGAAYQASAEDVKKAGRPLARHDAPEGKVEGITNSDYNKLYIELYNEARQYVNIPPGTHTSQKGIIGNSQTTRQLDAQEKQVMSDYEFATQTINTERQTALAKRQEAERRMEIARQFSDIEAYNTAMTELETLDTLLRDGDIKLRQVETLTRMEIDKINLARTDEYVKMAERELDAGNPEPFADMVTRGIGMLVEIVPIEGGKFAVYQNNELISGKGYTLKQVKDRYLSPISQAYEAQRVAQVEEERKFQSDVLKDDLKLARDITLEQVKASGEMQKQGWTEGKEVTDPNTGRITEKWFTKGDRVIRMRIAPDREENGLVVKGGVVVEDIATAGVKS